MPPYLQNAKVKTFVVSQQTTTSQINLGPAVDFNGLDDFINNF